MEIGGTSLVRFGDRAVRLPEGDWRVVASEAYGLHWDDPGGAFPRTRVGGWSLRLTQSSGPMARGTLLLWLATEQSQFFERLSWENEFCEKSRAGALFHENRGSYNQPECLLVQRTSAALALGPAQSLVAQLGGPLSSREGDLLVSYARHSRGAYLRVMALLPGQGVPDANAVAHGKAIASALQPLGGLQSRTAQWPMPPQL